MSARSPLAAWCLSTFHASAFVLVVLFALYHGGGLAGSLASLNTAVGFAAFIALWITTRFTTVRAVAASRTDDEFVRRAFRWGAANGALFLLLLIGAAALAAPFVNPAGGVFGSLAVLAFGVIALPFALVIGALVGFLLGVVDVALLALSRAIAARNVSR